jgi:hypothetical protein
LEDALFDDVEVDDLRVSVSGGPVFTTDDRVFRNVALPREFWKVITFVEAGVLKTSAFLLTQNLDQPQWSGQPGADVVSHHGQHQHWQYQGHMTRPRMEARRFLANRLDDATAASECGVALYRRIRPDQDGVRR